MRAEQKRASFPVDEPALLPKIRGFSRTHFLVAIIPTKAISIQKITYGWRSDNTTPSFEIVYFHSNYYYKSVQYF